MPAIGRIDTGALRASVDLVEYIESFIPLKRSSHGEKAARCPFHDEKTPSFTVTRSKQRYWCFGCGAHGDVIDFAMQYQGMGFRDAAIDIARFSGFELPTDDGLQEAEILKARREAIARKMEAAMALHVGVLALGTVPGDKPTPKDIKPTLAAVRVVRKAIPAMFDVSGPRETGDWPDDGNIHTELAGLWRGFLNRITERHHGRNIRAVRPEAGAFPLIPFEREVLAARRVIDWITETYPSDHERRRQRQ